jgi:2,5-diamino-6-(ribosylamino)-4(3H)-pyrimidinone 5'-phosphate reductase
VVVHTAVSADGRSVGFEPRVDVYYRLAASFREDVTLTGADTLLAARGQEGDGPTEPLPPPADGPLLAVTDSRGRLHDFAPLIGAGIWRGVLVLCSQATPADHLAHLDEVGVPWVSLGVESVDLGAAMALLGREHGTRTVRVDSGGRLSGALLWARLVDELSLLIHPVAVGGRSAALALGADGSPPFATGTPLGHPVVEPLEDGLLWLRWTVARHGAAAESG